MALKTKRVSELSSQQQGTFGRAKDAIAQKNYTYAFQMLRTLLQGEPGCTEARLALRLAQLEFHGGTISTGTKVSAFLKNALPVFVKGPSLLRKGLIGDALDVAEQAVLADPSSVPAVMFLVQSAMAAGWPMVAINALEATTRYNAGHVGTLQRLADLYEKVGDLSKSIQVRQQLCVLKPDDLSFENALKQATAKAALEDGKWEQASSYRDIIRDKDQAKTLEQQERIGSRDEETRHDLIRAAEEAVAQQASAGNHKKLADLYQQDGQFDKALEHYNQVVETSGALDPAIDNAITAVLASRFDDAIAQWNDYASEDSSREEEANERIAEIEQQKQDTILERYEQRVKRYPNDAVFHFELGQLYYDHERHDDALTEFQYSQKNPQYRRRALTLTGKCMAAKGLGDMAIEQLTSALGECGKMNDEKKDILYNLALLYEQAERSEEAQKALKEIYTADVNYEDVAQRIEKLYSKAE